MTTAAAVTNGTAAAKAEVKIEPVKPTQTLTPVNPHKAKAVEVISTAETKDLDGAVKKFHELNVAGYLNRYDLASHVRSEIFDKQAWKARKNKEGKVAYTSFEQFVAVEIGLSHTTVYQLMEVTKNYTRQQFLEVGATKLTLLLRAPESDKARLLEDAKSSSVRNTKKNVEQARSDAGETGKRKTGNKETPKGGRKPKAEPKPSNRGKMISIASIEGRKTLSLYAKPAGKDDPKRVRAEKIAQEPWCQLELENGVIMTFAVKTNATGLVLVINTARDEG